MTGDFAAALHVIEGLLALMLLHHSRAGTRLGALGEIVTLERQDRTRWNAQFIKEGTGLLVKALRRGRPGSYQLKAIALSGTDEEKHYLVGRRDELI